MAALTQQTSAALRGLFTRLPSSAEGVLGYFATPGFALGVGSTPLRGLFTALGPSGSGYLPMFGPYYALGVAGGPLPKMLTRLGPSGSGYTVAPGVYYNLGALPTTATWWTERFFQFNPAAPPVATTFPILSRTTTYPQRP